MSNATSSSVNSGHPVVFLTALSDFGSFHPILGRSVSFLRVQFNFPGSIQFNYSLHSDASVRLILGRFVGFLDLTV